LGPPLPPILGAFFLSVDPPFQRDLFFLLRYWGFIGWGAAGSRISGLSLPSTLVLFFGPRVFVVFLRASGGLIDAQTVIPRGLFAFVRRLSPPASVSSFPTETTSFWPPHKILGPCGFLGLGYPPPRGFGDFSAVVFFEKTFCYTKDSFPFCLGPPSC